MNDLVVWIVVVPIALVVGALIGGLLVSYVLKKQAKEWQKKMGELDKEQVRNISSALGKKLPEEQINRLINMAKSAERKRNPKNPKKVSSKSPKKKKNI